MARALREGPGAVGATGAEDLHHGATNLASAALERGLPPAGWPSRPACGTEPAVGLERAGLAAGHRPAVDPAQIHQGLVPLARCRRVEPRLRIIDEPIH
jgi:hypothetical protein